MPALDPTEQRNFAMDVFRRLREAGFEAYLAGGCVRDQLLGRTPKDYDVATSATPAEIRKLFGFRRTLAVGAAFGVITVVGPKPAGMVEVATFREDAGYSDGRRPDSVTFSSAAEDAKRRDFTINGLFYDATADRVIDYVGGCDDLKGRLIRAIGDPFERFAEDKLRMLRAVRFASFFGFAIEEQTLAAIGRMADEIAIVSPERIAMEMRRMLVEGGRCEAVRLLLVTGLARQVLPEIAGLEGERAEKLDEAIARLARLESPNFSLALAALLCELIDADGMFALGKRWRLANKEIEPACWLVEHHGKLRSAAALRPSQLQPILVARPIGDLLALERAAQESEADLAFCVEKLRQPRAQLDPPPLVFGGEVMARGVPAGPAVGKALMRLRAMQLDGELDSKAAALAQLERWLREGTIP